MSTFTWLLKGSKKNLAYSISYLQNKFNRNSRNEVLEYSNIVPSSSRPRCDTEPSAEFELV